MKWVNRSNNSLKRLNKKAQPNSWISKVEKNLYYFCVNNFFGHFDSVKDKFEGNDEPKLNLGMQNPEPG